MEAMSPRQARQLAPLTLAYIGDAVIELHVRRRVVAKGQATMHRINRRVVRYVRASAQARAFHLLQGRFSEHDHAVARRGRNAKSKHVRKNADITEYRLATGYEALVGFFELTDQPRKLDRALACLYEAVEGRGEETP